MSINTKYEFTGETQVVVGRTLRRIRAVRSFGNVEAGDLGGWIEKEDNLSYYEDCWVYDAACVYGNARVCGNAQVWGNALVCGNAQVWGNALVCDNAQVYGKARVCDNAQVYGNARVYSKARVYDNAQVYGNARVYSKARVYGNAQVSCNAVCSISPIVVTGLRYTVTITDKHIQIGCQQYTASKLRRCIPELSRKYKLTKREIRQLEFIIAESRAHSRIVTSTAKRKGTNK